MMVDDLRYSPAQMNALDGLRRRRGPELYATLAWAEGADPSGVCEVAVDATERVRWVHFTRLRAEDRWPEAVRGLIALARAHACIVREVTALDACGALDDLVHRGDTPAGARGAAASAHPPAHALGRSGHGYLEIEVYESGAVTAVRADRAWLDAATPEQLSRAAGQALESAHAQLDAAATAP